MIMKTTTLLVAVVALLGSSLATVRAESAVPKSYPLKKCVVSGEALGEHGKPVKVSYQGTDVYLCCNDCVKDFKKEPAKYAKMVKDAAAKK
jgi:YHS domain-containing protein